MKKRYKRLKTYAVTEVTSEDLTVAMFKGFGFALGNAMQTALPLRKSTPLQEVTRASLNCWADMFIFASCNSRSRAKFEITLDYRA